MQLNTWNKGTAWIVVSRSTSERKAGARSLLPAPCSAMKGKGMRWGKAKRFPCRKIPTQERSQSKAGIWDRQILFHKPTQSGLMRECKEPKGNEILRSKWYWAKMPRPMRIELCRLRRWGASSYDQNDRPNTQRWKRRTKVQISQWILCFYN